MASSLRDGAGVCVGSGSCGSLMEPPYRRKGQQTAARLREEVVVAGGRVVLLDDGLEVEREHPEVVDVDATGQALSGTAAGPRLAAEGAVALDRAVADRCARAVLDSEAAAQPVATVAS